MEKIVERVLRRAGVPPKPNLASVVHAVVSRKGALAQSYVSGCTESGRDARCSWPWWDEPGGLTTASLWDQFLYSIFAKLRPALTALFTRRPAEARLTVVIPSAFTSLSMLTPRFAAAVFMVVSVIVLSS
jgi:hypothetical protein